MIFRNSFLIFLQILYFTLREMKCQHFTYNVSSSQLNGWSTIKLLCLNSETSTTHNYNGGPIAKRSIHGNRSYGALKNDLDSTAKNDNTIDELTMKERQYNSSSFLNDTKVEEHLTESLNQYDSEELLQLYQSLVNETTQLKTSTPVPLIPTLIENVNFSTVHNNSRMNFDCDYVWLGANFFRASQSRMNLFSEGKLLLKSNWWNEIENTTILKILFESGFSPPQGCSWVPDSLTSLDLSHSPIIELELKNCKSSLVHLLLSGSSLNVLSICLPSLKELDVSWNSLTDSRMQTTCENGVNSIKKLKLSNNQMSSWSSCGWPSLVRLDLQTNKLLTLDLISCPPRHLVHLNLAHNRLKETPQRYPAKLATINLSHNKLKKTSQFNRLIQEVDFSHNSLTSLEKGTFRVAWQLLKLDLSYNKLSVIYARDFHGLYELRSLDLSHNDLQHIRHEAFHPLKRIQSIKLTNNALHRLDVRLLTYLPKNIAFEAFRNPWRCTCHLLALLTKLSRSRCLPDCSKMQELTCQEGHTEVKVRNVLLQCIQAAQDVSRPEASVYYLPDNSSEEDSSEEQQQDDSAKNFNYKIMAISCAVIIIVIPLMGLAVKKAYKKRNSIKKMFYCLEPSSGGSEQEERIQGWSDKRLRLDNESDSETEL